MSLHSLQAIPEKSIAVLPFVNMSADPDNEYFSDGITEEIINVLTTIKGLKVIARTSSFAFKGMHLDIRNIGRQLSVNTILEGSVRKSNNRVRITAQLIDTRDGTHLWSKNFNRELEDIFEVQDEISLLIADQIRENFGHFNIREHLIDAPTKNIEAYNLYLKGRYHHLKWNHDGIKTGIECYEQSIALDPTFSWPYFGIGYSFAMKASYQANPEFLQVAEQHLRKGFQFDDRSYLGYYAQATISFWGKWDFRAGQQQYLKAIELNPSFTEAEEGLTELYTFIGYFDKALEHVRNILTLNPLSPNHYYTKAHIYYLQEDYGETIQSLEAALRVDPDFSFAIELMQLCFIHLKDYQRLDQFLLVHPQAQRPLAARALYKLVHPDEPVEIDLEEVRAGLLDQSIGALVPWHLYLQVYLGHHDLALDILETAVENRTGQFVNFKFMPLLSPLQQNERYLQMVHTIFDPSGLPDLAADTQEEEAAVKALLEPQEVNFYLQALQHGMEQEQLYTDPALSLRDLAETIDLHPNKLSWLLNEHIGKNFNEYVNTFRLEDFKAKALDPANDHLTILGLAFDSGFNSKTVFNSFFKKMEGTTPRAWVKMKKE
jgi:TolB-like protein/AraC-like DNA-binding protein